MIIAALSDTQDILEMTSVTMQSHRLRDDSRNGSYQENEDHTQHGTIRDQNRNYGIGKIAAKCEIGDSRLFNKKLLPYKAHRWNQ